MTARSQAESWLGSRWLRVVLGFCVLSFCAAPVPGDVGGCNQRAEALDAAAFFTQKAEIDCARCGECALSGQLCDTACAALLPPPSDFAEGCAPTVHDGEVCLHALEAASCEDYRAFARDEAPTTPTECDFCPRSSE